MIPDALEAVRGFLLSQQDIIAQVGVNVYGVELPRELNESMPIRVVVLRPSGGPGDSGTLPLGESRYDVRCYGETPYDANLVHRLVSWSLKYMRRTVQGETFVHSATMESGPIALREPDGDWPFVFSAWLVKAGQVALT